MFCFSFNKNLIKVSFSLHLPSNPYKMTNINVVLNKFYDEYVNNTPKKLKIIDAYLFYIVLTGVTQFLYCCLVGSFPFNSFLSGFISTVSCFILGGISYLAKNPCLGRVGNNFFRFQYAFVCKRIRKINRSFTEFRRKEVLLTSYWLTSFYILLS